MGLARERESLYDRLDRLAGVSRWVVPAAIGLTGVAVLRAMWDGGRFGFAVGNFRWSVSDVVIPLLALALAGTFFILQGKVRTEPRPERHWGLERRLAAIEVAQAEDRDVARVSDGAATLFKGDFPSLDSALEMLQVASGEKVYPHFERLPESVYGERIDACVRLDGDNPILCFTPAMLETFGPEQLLAVIAHLLARVQLMRHPVGGTCDGVREADARALLLTRDHVALLRALEACRTGAIQIATPGDREAWFSEDEATPEEWDDTGQVVSWRRIDRVEELREHLGPLGLDVPLAPPEVRLSRLFDTGTQTLTEAAKEGLRR